MNLAEDQTTTVQCSLQMNLKRFVQKCQKAKHYQSLLLMA